MSILALALLAAPLPPIPSSPPKAAVAAEAKELKARAGELKKKKAWPLAPGQVVIARAEAGQGAPALLLVRGRSTHATVTCAVKEQSEAAGEPNAVAARVWSFTGGPAGTSANLRWQIAAQLREGKLETGARGDGENAHSAVFLEPVAAGARLVVGDCTVKGE